MTIYRHFSPSFSFIKYGDFLQAETRFSLIQSKLNNAAELINQLEEDINDIQDIIEDKMMSIEDEESGLDDE